MSEVDYVTFDEFDEQVLNSPVPVLVQLTADWCGPCKAMRPFVEQVAGVLHATETGLVVKVDIEQDPEIAEDYEVQSIPAFLLFDGGVLLDRLIGAVRLDDLISLFERNA